ncbi:MAG: FlgD immunoglobulin-like domain containing protein [Candidatus Eisenbacteria bacterium]
MKLKALWICLVAAVGVSLLVSSLLYCGPSKKDRQEIQEMMNRGKKLRETFEKERSEFVESGSEWLGNPTEENRQEALADLADRNAAEAALQANRDSTIAKVDSAFDDGIPPGADIKYDPNCGKDTDGYTSSRCYIRICEGGFKDGPDWLASTKIHEWEHVKQKSDGEWGPGIDGPKKCTWLYHWHEIEAYNAELQADFGSQTSLDDSLKQEIWERKLYHIEAGLRSIFPSWVAERIMRTLPDKIVHKSISIANDSDAAQYVSGYFEDDEGWLITPPGFEFWLESEQETTLTVDVEVPPMAELGLGNEVWCHVYSDIFPEPTGFATMQIDSASDFFFIHVIPAVDVIAGPDVSGFPLAQPSIGFTIINEGATPDTVDISLTSVLGWPLGQDYWIEPLNPGEWVDVVTYVELPDSAPFTTDLIYCHATSLTSPGHIDSSSLTAMVDDYLVGTPGEPDRFAFALMPNVPNPFTSGTLVRFSIPVASPVDLKVYDVRGRLVRTLMRAGSDVVQPGIHTVRWDGKDNDGNQLASGVYFSELNAGGRKATRKLVMLK